MFDKSKYRPRLIDDMVDLYLSTFGAVCLEGPKWCGKTWTSQLHSKSAFFVGSPKDNFANRQLARLEVSKALEGKAPHLIDEWQEVGSIWDAVRAEVDESNEVGRFILTGSATPQQKGVLHQYRAVLDVLEVARPHKAVIQTAFLRPFDCCRAFGSIRENAVAGLANIRLFV